MLVHVSQLRVDLAKAGQWGIGLPLRCPTDSFSATPGDGPGVLERGDIQPRGATATAYADTGRETRS
jgi:hypothetical protein